MFDSKTIGAIRSAQNILVIKLRYIGDSIWMLPFVDNLKQNLPDTKITVLINEGTEAFFINRPSVDCLIAFPRNRLKGKFTGFFRSLSFLGYIKSFRPDVVIELTDNDRAAIISYFSGARVRISYNNENKWRRKLYTHFCSTKIFTKHMVDYNLDILRQLGMKIYDPSIKINTEADAINSLYVKCPSVLEKKSEKKKIIIHPGSRTPLRQWGIRNFAYVNDALSEKHRVFLISGPQEKKLLNDVYAAAKIKPEICTSELNINEFAALCELSDIFIGNDSGPIHIASAKTFTVGIYGPNVPDIAGPWTDRKLIFEGNKLFCRPCKQDKCLNEEFKKCINQIKPENVIEKIKEILTTL